jgi:hypothetical protein
MMAIRRASTRVPSLRMRVWHEFLQALDIAAHFLDPALSLTKVAKNMRISPRCVQGCWKYPERPLPSK